MRRPRIASEVFRRLPLHVRHELLHRSGYFAPWEEGFDFTPPALRPGEVSGPPDFVGVGAQKAGTSWWYALVVDHPVVADREDLPKERHYLSRFCTAPFGAAEIARYHGWFPRTPGMLTGEWTPDYLPYPWVPPLLAQAAPDAKVLVLLRDPVERFRSGLTFRRAQGAHDTAATVADAVRQGYYAEHLRALFDSVPKSQVLVQQYEACRREPLHELARTYAFLGLDPFAPDDLRREVNVSGGAKVALDDEARARLVDLYRADVAQLVDLVPGVDLALWPNFSELS
jgi:Sulfotransferase family